MIQELGSKLQSRTRALELCLVKAGIKPSARIAFSNVDNAKSLLDELGLSYAISDFKVKMDFKGMYSTKGHVVGLEKEGHVFFYIAKDKRTAEKTRLAEKDGGIEELGIALGYPQCCIDFFAKNRNDEIKNENDYIIPSLNNTKSNSHSFHLNVFARYFDFCLVSHAPHSLDCEKSLELAKKTMSFLAKIEPQLGFTYQQFMSGVALHSNQGIVWLPQAKIIDDNIKFKHILSSPKDIPLALLLREQGKARIQTGQVIIAKKAIPVNWHVFS